MKNKLIIVVALVIVAAMAIGASGITSIRKIKGYRSDTGTLSGYANSDLDSFYVSREEGLSALAFSIQFNDSVSTTYSRIYRLINGIPMALQVGDSITTLTTFSAIAATANQTSAITQTIPLTPLCDQYLVVIKFAASNNGVTNNTATVEFQKQYSAK